MRNKVNTSMRSDSEWLNLLARWWKMDIEDIQKPFKVIARFVKSSKKDVNNRDYGYFVDVRNLNGDILYYPMGLGLVKIFCLYRESFDNGEYWQINVKLDARNRREKYNNPFLLTMSDTIAGKPKLRFVDKLNKEKFIKNIFEETGSTPRDAKNISNALHAIMGDLYTETERFIFELLQNADDQPLNESLVNVTLKTLTENLLFMHTGKPFCEADVESISSIGDSTKKNDAEKTGYKGIGFKSVFSDAETVYIDSGNFSFAFDKNSPLYADEEDMDVIPWQIKPIWEEKYRLPLEVQDNIQFFNAAVGIALNVGKEHICNYNKIIPDLLSEPRFVLFLRNVGKIVFENNSGDTIEIFKTPSDESIKVSSNDRTEEWIIKDYIITIPEDTRDAMQSEKLIPAKLKEATKTKITFAAKVEGKSIVPIDDAVLFTYLPTKVDDYGFKFLVNADFLTTASRESIHFKNVWNKFLFSQIGYLLVDWVSTLSNYNGVLQLLPQHINDDENPLTSEFYKSYTKALSEKSFVKGHNQEVLALSNLMIDRSGLSKILGKNLFCKIVNSAKALPLDDKDDEIIYLLGEANLCEIDELAPSPVIGKLKGNAQFLSWFVSSSEDKKIELYNWLVSKETEESKPGIQSVIEGLPIYVFNGHYCSKDDTLSDSNKIVMRADMEGLRSVFEECGFECSNNIDSLPIAKFYTSNVISATFDSIFKVFLSNQNFTTWLSNGTAESQSILVNWLDEHYKPSLKTTFENFVSALPLFHFSDASLNRLNVDADNNRLIIDQSLDPYRELLTKIGFNCSANVDDSVFVKYIVKSKGITLYEKIYEQARVCLKENSKLLSPSEKLSLFLLFKGLEGVGDAKLSGIILFVNETKTYRKALKNMCVNDESLPHWLKEYQIHTDENFPELQEYLVSKEKVFDEIVKPNIDAILQQTSLKDIYLYFKDSWTLLFTKKIINEKGISEDTLDLVEQQDNDSKLFFIQKITKIVLDINCIYKPTDYIFRLLSIAFEVLDDAQIRSFASKIFVGDRSVLSFTVSDDVEMTYHEGKVMHLSLSNILPDYQDIGMISKIKQCLSEFGTLKLERILSLTSMNTKDIYDKMNTTNGYSVSQYLFALYRTRKIRNWNNSYVPNIDLSKVSESWMFNLLEILYSQKVELYNDCFGYRLTSYFTNKFLSNEYVIDSERILSSIEKWANNEEKRSYLISLGTKTERAKLIQLRKSIIENNVVGVADVEDQKDFIPSTIDLFLEKGLLPFTEANQIEAMLMFKPYYRYLSIVVDTEVLEKEASEYDLPEYLSRKNDINISVYKTSQRIPKVLIQTNKENLIICRFNEGDYYYNPSSKILYINENCEIRDILYTVVSDNSIPFNAGDWQQLYYHNLVTKEIVENKQKEIDELKEKLDQYIKKFGKLSVSSSSEKQEETQKNSDKNNKDKNTNEKNSHTEQNEGNKPSANIKGNNGSASKRDQYSAQLEAQQFLMQQRPDWSYPDGFGECDELGKPLCYSAFSVKNESGSYMPIVLKSYKSTNEPFRINPEEWESVAVESAKLLVYTYLNSQFVIVEVPQADLVKNQPNITISFSTENLDSKEHEDRLSIFADALHYFKELTFDFTSFHVSANAVRVKDIFAKNDGIAITASLDDL